MSEPLANVPQSAIDAAVAAVQKFYRNQLDGPALRRDVTAALTAAAPHIVAAARVKDE